MTYTISFFAAGRRGASVALGTGMLCLILLAGCAKTASSPIPEAPAQASSTAQRHMPTGGAPAFAPSVLAALPTGPGAVASSSKGLTSYHNAALIKCEHCAKLGKDLVLSSFGPRKSGKRTRTHQGVDLKAPMGSDVLAYQGGEVIVSGRRSGYGLSVDIQHPDGTITRYAHMSKLEVKKGDRLQRSDVVGKVGRTGRATTAHLHFEVIKNAKRVNPMPYLAGIEQVLRCIKATESEVAQAPSPSRNVTR